MTTADSPTSLAVRNRFSLIAEVLGCDDAKRAYAEYLWWAEHGKDLRGYADPTCPDALIECFADLWLCRWAELSGGLGVCASCGGLGPEDCCTAGSFRVTARDFIGRPTAGVHEACGETMSTVSDDCKCRLLCDDSGLDRCQIDRPFRVERERYLTEHECSVLRDWLMNAQQGSRQIKTDARGMVHHSRCMSSDGTNCCCPLSWPRLPEHVSLTHRRSGNCKLSTSWDGVHCPIHSNETRGACSKCGRCPACDTRTTKRKPL